MATCSPIGYPETAAICGRVGCENPGLLWLKRSEYNAWQEGQTVFKPHTNTVKVRVEPFRL